MISILPDRRWISLRIIHGPYNPLDAGEYEIIFVYESDSPEGISFDVAANGGEIVDLHLILTQF